MVEYMIEGRPFLYQAKAGAVYHVAEEGVEVAQSSSWPSDETIVALVDGDAKDFALNDILNHHSVQLIVASSPKVENLDWIKQAGPASVTQLVVYLWTHKEVLLTGLVSPSIAFDTQLMPLRRIFLTPSDLSFKLLLEATSYFGYNPRRCFDASLSVANMETNIEDLKTLIKDAPNSSYNIIQLVHKSRTGGSTISHRIFQIFPLNDNRRLVECQFEPVSRWALDLLLQQYEDCKRNAVADFYHTISGTPGAASFRGYLFERQVLSHLCGIEDSHRFLIRGLTDSRRMTWTYSGPIPHITFHESTIFSEITKAVGNKNRLHMIPLARNFPAVDSIIYDPNTVLTCIQITLNKVHPISVSGLRAIQSWLRLGTPLKDLRPSKNKPWRFVFVVPSGMADTFRLQDVVDDAGKPDNVGDWPNKVKQYVLELEEDSIFRRTDSSPRSLPLPVSFLLSLCSLI